MLSATDGEQMTYDKFIEDAEDEEEKMRRKLYCIWAYIIAPKVNADKPKAIIKEYEETKK